MKTGITVSEIRAGVIGALALAIGWLCFAGFSNEFRVWACIVLVAVGFVLVVKSLVDLLAWGFGLAAAFAGRGLGRAVRLIRGL
jgi:hypothetical protein